MIRHRRGWGYSVLMALLAALGGAAARPVPVAGDEVFTAFLPAIHLTFVPANLANGSFEDNTVIGLPNWPNCEYQGPPPDEQGNQHPEGWDFYSPAAGEAMPFPRIKGGQPVPAISDGPGEYVHRCQWQFPEIEWPGMPRALILDGYWSYKAFGYYIAQALRLSQTLTGNPGEYVRVTGYILGETHESPPLADDNFIASVQLGSAADTRVYGVMIQNHDVPGNERAWNRFQVTAQVPASGQLTLTIIVQQNFKNRTDFFLDHFSAERVFSAP
jgi:hypothetical protein